MSTGIPFVRSAPSRPKRQRSENRSEILARMARQADQVRATQDWSKADDLSMLAYMVRCASPRARSVRWKGIRFPLASGFIIRAALCPDTGRQLVGVVG